MKFSILFFLCWLFSFSALAGGSTDGSRVLIVQTIGTGMHRYSVRIPGCGKTINNLKLQVDNGPLEVALAGAKFSDGTSNSVSLGQTFDAGYVSPWIATDNFNPESKCVTQLFVDAQAADARKTSRLTVYGANF